MKFRSTAMCLALTMAVVLSGVGCASQKTTKATREPLWDAGTQRDKIVVISDLHLGIDDAFTETLANRPLLVEFLQRLQATADVRELVIAGDFLDEWYLPVYYPSYTDEVNFYQAVVANNQEVIDELNHVADSGINVVYVPGNHDMTLEEEVLQQAIPKIQQMRDAKGLGYYYTGDRHEVVIEHGHRYDVFSAPDTVTNAELVGNDNTIFPAGYFYARYAATWVLEGRPAVAKDLPVVTNIPSKSNLDQFGAYVYYSLLKNVSTRMTPTQALDEPIFDIHVAGFDDAYTYLDFYPCQQADGTISAPVLYRNIQRTWEERQEINNVKVPTDFITAVSGTLDWNYYAQQAKIQYLDNPEEAVEVVLFGHTHVPVLKDFQDGTYYVNSGTWVDHNTDYPDATRTFVVITTGTQDDIGVYSYNTDGTLWDISKKVSE